LDFAPVLIAAAVGSGSTLLVGQVVYLRSRRDTWRQARVGAYTAFVGALSDLLSLGTVMAMSGALSPVSDEDFKVKYSALARAAHEILLVGRNEAIARAGLTFRLVNREIVPLLLRGGDANAWESAVAQARDAETAFVDSVRRERFGPGGQVSAPRTAPSET
jgi:hypothetical protein